MNPYLLVLFRVITIMALLLFSTLFIMGKRPIGELPVFDFLSLIVIGAIVGADIAEPKIKHLPTAFAVVVLALLQRVVSEYMIRNSKFKKIVSFEPTVIIQDGKLIHKNIKKIKYTVDEVLMILREKDIFDFSIIKYALIESSGNISVLKKSQNENVRLKDLNIDSLEASIPLIVVLEKKLIIENIKRLGFTEKEVLIKLDKSGYLDLESIFIATMDNVGDINVSTYTEKSDIINN